MRLMRSRRSLIGLAARARAIVALAGAVLALAACGGSTETQPPLVFTITPAQRTVTGTRTTDPLSGPTLSCDYDFDVVASGGQPGDIARWENGTLDWHLLSPETTDREELRAVDLEDWFQSGYLVTGDRITVRRYAYWASPFDVTHTFRYRLPSGEVKATTFVLHCR